MKKIFESAEYLTVMCALGIVAGLMLAIRPDLASDGLISLVGVMWVLDGIHYGAKAVKKRLEDNEKMMNKDKKTEI